MWDKWAYQRIGVRAYMRSTYDRTGGNEGADASHFLYQTADDFNVTLDTLGPGVLYFARYNHWHGSPWHYEVDGTDHIVQESSSLDPKKPVANSNFLPALPFPPPLNWTWADTRGADLIWTPIPFEKSFRMAYSRTHYGTGYYIYHMFADGTRLSQPIKSWDAKSPPDNDVLELLSHSASSLLPTPGSAQADAMGLRFTSGALDLPHGTTVNVAQLTDAPATIRSLEFSVPRANSVAFSKAILRVTWDNRTQPSIETPVALFFGAGTLYNRDNKEYLVKSFPMTIRFDEKRVYLTCCFPMPYFKSAALQLTGVESDIADVQWRIGTAPYRDPANHAAYFHATYRDHPHPAEGLDLVLLETAKVEDSNDWSGSFVGTSFIFSHNANLGTLEGDPRFFFDDALTPQAYGTGTEEWGGGGDYWGGQTMTLPLAGHPVGAPNAQKAKEPEDNIESAYRFLLADLMPFGKNAVIRLEHGGTNTSKEHYETVTYWYGLPAPSMLKTDQLNIGSAESETTHHYLSPDASKPYELTGMYEWGKDWIVHQKPPAQDYPTVPTFTRMGRYTKTWSEFTLTLQPDNYGVCLRRTLDYSFPNQRAKVFVAEVPANADAKPEWKPAGTWYLAGSNTCVYSNPADELGATQHKVQTSNRRLRDDEFLIGLNLTRGRAAICVRIEFDPARIPLFPGHPLATADEAWSEMEYAAYCFVMPKWPEK